MACSSIRPFTLILQFCFLLFTHAANITYDFNITWVSANPDGLFNRPTIGINGQWPIPHITATVGDHVVVNVENQLGNQTTSLHFHGLYMNGTNEMDGVTGTTQCSIPPGSSFTYSFDVCYLPRRSFCMLISARLINLARIGTILTTMDSTPTDYEVL